MFEKLKFKISCKYKLQAFEVLLEHPVVFTEPDIRMADIRNSDIRWDLSWSVI